MSVFHRILVKNGDVVCKKVIQLWSILSPVRAHGDLNKWCFVIVPALEAGEHNPNSDHCSEVLREIV